MARHHMRGENPGHTLQTTALVNEAYLRLVDGASVSWRDRAHFFAVSAQIMRRILVDAARARTTAKRGGIVPRVRLDDVPDVSTERAGELLAIDEALTAKRARVSTVILIGYIDSNISHSRTLRQRHHDQP